MHSGNCLGKNLTMKHDPKETEIIQAANEVNPGVNQVEYPHAPIREKEHDGVYADDDEE